MFEVRTFGQIVILDTQNLDHHSSENIGVQIEPQEFLTSNDSETPFRGLFASVFNSNQTPPVDNCYP